MIELRPAGLTARFYAFLIDQMIRFSVLSVLAGVTGTMQGIGIGIYLIAIFALEWFYPVAFELEPLGRHARQAHLQAQGRHG